MPCSGIPFPDRHALHISWAGKYVKISVVDKHGIAENIKACQQHFVQRMFAVQGILQMCVPLPVFCKGFLHHLKGIQEIRAVLQLNDGTAWVKTGDIRMSHTNKADVFIFREGVIHILALQKVDKPGIQALSPFIEADAFQTGAVVLGIESDILVVRGKGVR